MKVNTLLILSLASVSVCMIPVGCGLVTAPVSVPDAVASNANFSFHGQTVDIKGAPLDSVLLAQQLDHHFWTPIAGGTDTDEHRLRRIDRTFRVDERGSTLKLTFSHDGYFDSEYDFNASDSKYVSTSSGDWPNSDGFPVVMISRAPNDEMLANWSGDINYSSYPRQPVIDLNTLEAYTRSFSERNADEPNASTSGLLFLHMIKETPRAINSHGDIDPQEVNLPGSVTLHITGQNGGFVRIMPQLGYSPMQVSDAAPSNGYEPDFTISRSRLREMRSSPLSRIMEAHEYFFFRFANRFGKGFISWQYTLDPFSKQVQPVSFHYSFWLQRYANNPNLTSHQAKSI